MTFSGSRLRSARLLQGLSQRELADRVAVANGQIGEFEAGTREPKPDVVEALAAVTQVEPAFYQETKVIEVGASSANFRSKIAATERQKRQVLAQASFFALIISEIASIVPLPQFDVPQLVPRTLGDIERIAADCRRHWGIDADAPIGSMMRVIENAGIVVMRMDCDTGEQVDAFSSYDAVNIIVLSSEKGSSSRSFFDAAHELGHAVMHRESVVSLEQREAEAQRFASAFILPQEAFAEEYLEHGRTDWGHFLELKARWKASVAAILYRAHQIRLIDAAAYRYRFREMARQGWRTGEPEEAPHEEPELFSLALEEFRNVTGKTPWDLCRSLAITPVLFERVTGVRVERPTVAGVMSIDAYRRRVAGQ